MLQLACEFDAAPEFQDHTQAQRVPAVRSISDTSSTVSRFCIAKFNVDWLICYPSVARPKEARR